MHPRRQRLLMKIAWKQLLTEYIPNRDDTAFMESLSSRKNAEGNRSRI
jgi:hypothetical protein